MRFVLHVWDRRKCMWWSRQVQDEVDWSVYKSPRLEIVKVTKSYTMASAMPLVQVFVRRREVRANEG